VRPSLWGAKKAATGGGEAALLGSFGVRDPYPEGEVVLTSLVTFSSEKDHFILGKEGFYQEEKGRSLFLRENQGNSSLQLS